MRDVGALADRRGVALRVASRHHDLGELHPREAAQDFAAVRVPVAVLREPGVGLLPEDAFAGRRCSLTSRRQAEGLLLRPGRRAEASEFEQVRYLRALVLPVVHRALSK